MDRITQEIKNNMVDYDEYYAQNVVIPSKKGTDNFGQNYGRYYSSFYNPGADKLSATGKLGLLGFDCNEKDADSPTGFSRNKSNCIIQTKTKDKNTGQNPFEGKLGDETADKENAFCGAVSYEITDGESTAASTTGQLPDGTPLCPAENGAKTAQRELYLISPDGRTKTIFAREKIGIDKNGNSMYALSFLRMKGEDLKGEDGVPDSFKCDDGFECTGDSGVNCKKGDYPASRANELNPDDDAFKAATCDNKENAFSKDFVPISPFRVNIADLKFLISPAENPQYAFSENDEQMQPRVSIILTVEPNPEYMSSKTLFKTITIEKTVSSRILTPIKAPVLAE